MASTKVLAEMAVRISAQTAEFGKAMRSVSSDLKGFTSTVQSANKLLTAFGIGFGVLQIINGIKNAIGVMADFERTMSEVKAITGATGDEFKALEDDAKRLGASTKFTTTQVGQLQVAYGRLGFTTKEILAATEATLDLATATGEDLAKSADVAGSTVRGFGLDASETQRVVDVMASSFNKTALGLDNFTESMKYVAPIAAAAGATVEETTALLGVLADAGIRGSTAGTSLRKIFTDMAKDGRPLRERLAELSAKGITLTDAFDEVGRTAQTSLLVLSKNTQKADELTAAFGNVSGEAAKMARIMSDNLTGDVKKLTSAWEGLIIALTNSAILRKLTQELTLLLNSLSGNKDLSIALDRLAESLTREDRSAHKTVFKILIEDLKKIREESGKPIDLNVVGELAEKYKLTDKQASTLYETILDINNAISFQEKALQQFNEFVKRNGYEDLTKAAEDYKNQLYENILAQQLLAEEAKKPVKGVDQTAVIENAENQVKAYRKVIAIINEYISTLNAQKKKEDEITAKQIENLDLYQDLLKKKNEEYEMASVNDPKRLRLLAAEIAALQDKIDKLNAIRKLAQTDQVALSSTNTTQFGSKIDTSKLTDQVLKAPDFTPFKTFFEQYAEAIQKLRDSLTGLKQHVIQIDLGGMIASAVSDMAFALGEAAAGVGNFGTAILKSVIGFAKQLGATLVAAGFAMLKFRMVIRNPGAAIAAGVALLAVAGAASAALNRAQSNFNSGGSGSGSGSRSDSPGISEATRTQQIALTVEPFAIRGQDLYLILKNYEKNSQYTSSING